MKRKQWFTLGVAVFATLLFFSLTRADQPQSKIAPCIANWDNLTWEERAECTEPWGGIYLAEGTVTALKQQTVDALPTQSRDSIRATQQAMWVEGGRPTLVPPTLTPVPGVIPEGWEVVEPYRNPYQGEGQDLHWLKSTINAWWLGAIIADDGYPRRIIVKSSSRMCGLGIRHIKLNGLPAKGEGYGIFCPEDIGWLRITGTTGKTGVITLTDELDRAIIFDLATEEWTLEGEPWLPVPTVEPQP